MYRDWYIQKVSTQLGISQIFVKCSPQKFGKDCPLKRANSVGVRLRSRKWCGKDSPNLDSKLVSWKELSLALFRLWTSWFTVCSHFVALVDALDAGLFIKGHGSLLLDRKSVELNVPGEQWWVGPFSLRFCSGGENNYAKPFQGNLEHTPSSLPKFKIAPEKLPSQTFPIGK